MTTGSLYFQPTGDRQLWRYDLTNAHSKVVLPVYATPGLVENQSYWMIIPAIAVSEGPWNRLASVLDPLSLHKGPDFWVVKAADFNAEKCEGVTPEYYFRYADHGNESTGFRSRPIYGALRGPIPSEDFIEEVFKRTAAAELKVMRSVWLAIQQELPRYLLASGQPVKLGWCELRALPYRANWKQILLAKYKKILTVLRKSKTERDDLLFRSGFNVAQLSTALMSIDGKHDPYTIGWTVECDLAEVWHDYVQSHEDDVLKAIGPNKYFRRAIELFSRVRVHALAIFTRWVEQTARPCGTVVNRRSLGGNRLAPALRPGGVRPQGDGDLEVSITTPADAVALYDLDGTPFVDQPVENLPPVPVVVLHAQDLRDDRGNLPATDEG